MRLPARRDERDLATALPSLLGPKSRSARNATTFGDCEYILEGRSFGSVWETSATHSALGFGELRTNPTELRPGFDQFCASSSASGLRSANLGPDSTKAGFKIHPSVPNSDAKVMLNQESSIMFRSPECQHNLLLRLNTRGAGNVDTPHQGITNGSRKTAEARRVSDDLRAGAGAH